MIPKFLSQVVAKTLFLRCFFKLENALPSNNTFSRLFRLLDPDQIRAARVPSMDCRHKPILIGDQFSTPIGTRPSDPARRRPGGNWTVRTAVCRPWASLVWRLQLHRLVRAQLLRCNEQPIEQIRQNGLFSLGQPRLNDCLPSPPFRPQAVHQVLTTARELPRAASGIALRRRRCDKPATTQRGQNAADETFVHRGKRDDLMCREWAFAPEIAEHAHLRQPNAEMRAVVLGRAFEQRAGERVQPEVDRLLLPWRLWLAQFVVSNLKASVALDTISRPPMQP